MRNREPRIRVDELWRRMSALAGLPRKLLVLLTIAALLGGFAEAGLLVLLVQLAFAVSDEAAGDFPGLGALDLSIGPLFALAAGFALARLGFQVWSAHLAARASTDIVVRLRTEVFDAFEHASWPRQSRALGGELRELIHSHTKAAGSLTLAASALVVAAVNFAALLASSVVVNFVGSLIMVLVALMLFVVLRPISGLSRRYGEEQSNDSLRYAQDLHEAVGMALEMKVFNTGRAVAARLRDSLGMVAGSFYRLSFLSGAFSAVYQTLAVLLIIAGLGLLYGFGIASVGSMSAVILLLIRSLSYSQGVQAALNRIDTVQPVVVRLGDTLDDLRANAVPSGGSAIKRVNQIEFRDVSYTYTGGRRALQGVSFAVSRGEVIGIAGPSGAGKSTLVQILLRLRAPTKGSLLVNQEPAPSFSFEDWYRLVAYVPQDCRLMSGSVAENIRWLRPWIEDATIERAAQMAHIHDEVISWPNGYETQVGEGGGAVSGGQRQRICLARAFVGGPELIVLDEPTSALDARSEQLVRQTLKEIKGQITVFVIAHRDSMLEACDRVLRFQEGLLVSFDHSHAGTSEVGAKVVQ